MSYSKSLMTPACTGLPKDYGWVCAIAVDSVLVNQFLAFRVMKARKEHNVKVTIAIYLLLFFAFPFVTSSTQGCIILIQIMCLTVSNVLTKICKIWYLKKTLTCKH